MEFHSKIIILILLLIGEALSVYTEMLGAKYFITRPFLAVFLKMFLLMTLAGGFLVTEYMLGFSAFKNIQIVGVASITSILIVEPFLHELFFIKFQPKVQ